MFTVAATVCLFTVTMSGGFIKAARMTRNWITNGHEWLLLLLS
jgi:hypothetical protein